MKNIILFFVILINTTVCRAAELPTPTARFVFNGTRYIGTATLINTTIRDNALYLDGKYCYYCTNASEGYTAVFRPSVFNYQKFTVATKLQTEDFTNGRTLFVGGTHCRWLAINVNSQGRIELKLNNGRFSRDIEGINLIQGNWASITISFDLTAKKIVVYFNGNRASQILLPPDFVLEIINDSEWNKDDKAWTFTNYSNGRTFRGLIAGLLTFDTILSDDQVLQLFQMMSSLGH